MGDSTQLMPLYTGAKLTNGAYAKMHTSIGSCIHQVGESVVKAQAEATDYNQKVARLSELVKLERAYVLTPQIERDDSGRDALLKAMYFYHRQLRKFLPKDHSLYPCVEQLSPLMTSAHNVWRSERALQTTEIQSLLRQLGEKANKEAVEKLGLKGAVVSLEAMNDQCSSNMDRRAVAVGERIAFRNGDSTRAVRKEVSAAYRKLVNKINAVLTLEETTDEVKKMVQDVQGIVQSYRVIAANTGKSQKQDEEPAPEQQEVKEA
ncbi:MAG: hypothetical protein IJ244_08700 [Bacteroidaceae bacterium]|nr:hypothetical protein [Bacteroidaceae bacterium]